MDKPYTAILITEHEQEVSARFDDLHIEDYHVDYFNAGCVKRVEGYIGDDRTDPLFVFVFDETLRYDWIVWVKSHVSGEGLKFGYHGVGIRTTILNALSLYFLFSSLGTRGTVLEPFPPR